MLLSARHLLSLLLTSTIFSRSLLPEELGLKKEKLSHLHFYFHDIVSGRNLTTVRVAEAKMTSMSATGFGIVVMTDNLLTEGPELSSKIVGWAQGLYLSSSLNGIGLPMVQNYVFTEGMYNGSTLSVLGQDAVFSDVREMPIVDRSRLFWFARGGLVSRTSAFRHWPKFPTSFSSSADPSWGFLCYR
ncbi:dirigent protein 1-like [Eucalyptus grandis]|uniref:dirigent protein 1-like n=1 Tax=Eucalyptus grandis TaxID=71139 RepID=UPI00192EEC6F|nr:dirigent protein 1-like [Eucalyptus grandis]